VIQGPVLFFILILSRVGTFVAVMPLFGGRSAPQVVRVGLAMALAVFWFGSLAPPADIGKLIGPASPSWFLYGLVLAREALLGAMVGLLFSLFLAPARIAGEIITGQIGLAATTVLNPAGDNSAAPLTIIFETLAGILFLELDGHHIVLAVLHASFARYPLGGTLMPVPTDQLIAGVSSAESLGVLLAGPLALAMLLVTLVLALMARVAPQLNIYSVGFTLQAGVALVASFVLLPDLMRALALVFARVGEIVAGTG
jgi:flagellar biosynthetic protein FliR